MCRKSKGITEVLIKYPRPNPDDLFETNRRTLLIVNAESSNPEDIIKFLSRNESLGNNLPAETATKSGGAAKQVFGRFNFSKGSKRVAVGASAIIGAPFNSKSTGRWLCKNSKTWLVLQRGR